MPLTKTIKDKNWDKVFVPVDHNETLGDTPHKLNLLRLSVDGTKFIFDEFQKFLHQNIGYYVHSRAKIDEFKTDDDLASIGSTAIGLLKKSANFDENALADEMGNITLYAFLEHLLEAPKIYNKVELAQYGDFDIKNAGCVHLLPTPDGTTSHQIVYGQSHVSGDPKDAIDNAFIALKSVIDNKTEEKRVLENTILTQSLSKENAEALKAIIIPTKASIQPPKKSFGVFLGYSIGMNGDVTDDNFLTELVAKMDADIKAHVQYIKDKIIECKMESYSFYFYFLPFNDADNDKNEIMKAVLGGVV